MPQKCWTSVGKAKKQGGQKGDNRGGLGLKFGFGLGFRLGEIWD